MNETTSGKQCTVPGCNAPHKARGMCNTHYHAEWTAGRIDDPMRFYTDPDDRFNASVTLSDGVISTRPAITTPCLLWQGGKDTAGQPAMRAGGVTVRVNRWVWERQNGPIPVGAMVRRRCKVRSCVRVDHLMLVPGPDTPREPGPGGGPARICRAGHVVDDGNSLPYPLETHGIRVCRLCARADWQHRAETVRRARLLTGLKVKDYIAVYGQGARAARRIIAEHGDFRAR
jgi:hypothetical protein